MRDEFDAMAANLGAMLPQVLATLLILFVGGFVAWLLGRLTESLLARLGLDERLARSMPPGEHLDEAGRPRLSVARAGGRLVFFGGLLFVFIGVVEAAGVAGMGAPAAGLLERVFAFLPQLLGALLLLGVAFIVATLARGATRRALLSSRFDERFSEQVDDPGAPKRRRLSETLSETAYYLVFLFFLPAILGTLALEGVLGPVQNLLDRVISAIPQIVMAALIVGVGYFVARVMRRLTEGLLASAGVDRLTERIGIRRSESGAMSLSNILGVIVFALIFIPALIAGLNALGIEAIAAPATEMLAMVLGAIPAILGAAIILGLAYFVGRFAAGIVEELLRSAGFDQLPERFGLARSKEELEATPDAREPVLPSRIVGYVVLAAILLLGAMEASALLGFEGLAVMFAETLEFGAQILIGSVIIVIGLGFANMAAKAIRSSSVANADTLSTIARVAIVALAGAMALKRMGLADEIVNLAFGLTLGALALAGALAFGLGGREAAARMLSRLDGVEEPIRGPGGGGGGPRPEHEERAQGAARYREDEGPIAKPREPRDDERGTAH